MIQHAVANGLPFEAVACDDLYGRADWFRAKLAGAGLVYMADVPCTTQVYLTRPAFGIPETPPDHRGPKHKLPRVLSDEKPIAISEVAKLPDTQWQRIRVRPTERGYLVADFAARQCVDPARRETDRRMVAVRRDADGDHRYALSDAHAETLLRTWRGCTVSATSWNAASKTPNPRWAGMSFRRRNSGPGSISGVERFLASGHCSDKTALGTGVSARSRVVSGTGRRSLAGIVGRERARVAPCGDAAASVVA